jgi:sporulation protein YlmC with PRC-barrel domain
VSASRVFIARLAGCGVFDPAGDRVGKVIDVLVAYRKSGSPKATGMLVEISGRRRVFVPIARVTSISAGQVITTGLIDLRRFVQSGREVRVIAQMLGRKVRLLDGTGSANIEDLAIEEGKNKLITVLCESPLAMRSFISWYNDLNSGKILLRDIIDVETAYAREMGIVLGSEESYLCVSDLEFFEPLLPLPPLYKHFAVRVLKPMSLDVYLYLPSDPWVAPMFF